MATSDDDSLEDLFPNLRIAGYAFTSPKSATYNCIAWAAGDDTTRWDPSPLYYWPTRIPRNQTVKTVARVFLALGYTICSDDSVETGFEKVAIYSRGDRNFTHVARQLENGRWTSKLGRLEDIEHGSLEALVSDDYGTVALILKRPRKE